MAKRADKNSSSTWGQQSQTQKRPRRVQQEAVGAGLGWWLHECGLNKPNRAVWLGYTGCVQYNFITLYPKVRCNAWLVFRAKNRCRNLILKTDSMEFYCQDMALCVPLVARTTELKNTTRKKELEAVQKYHVVAFSLHREHSLFFSVQEHLQNKSHFWVQVFNSLFISKSLRERNSLLCASKPKSRVSLCNSRMQ